MKKSPLSMPSGSRDKKSYSWKSQDLKHRTGYGYIKSDSYQCISPNGGKGVYGDDFVPLNISTPESNRKSSNWYNSGGSNHRNHRNTGSGGFNHYRNNYHASPKPNFNNSYCPYKHAGKQFHGQKKGFQRDARKQIDISRYIDTKSFLEDPWAELTKKLNDSKQTNEGDSLKVECSISSQSNYRHKLDLSESLSATDVDSSQYSYGSRNDSSISLSVGLNDTNINEVSEADSSIEINLDDVNLNQQSKTESLCSANGSVNSNVCEDISKDGVTAILSERTDQKSI